MPDLVCQCSYCGRVRIGTEWTRDASVEPDVVGLSLGGSGFSGRLHEIREQIRREGLTVRCIEDEEGATYRLEVLGG